MEKAEPRSFIWLYLLDLDRNSVYSSTIRGKSFSTRTFLVMESMGQTTISDPEQRGDVCAGGHSS